MKVILLEDVKGKGKKDQVIDVANGYGNYLISNKLALVADDENLALLAKQKEQEKIDEERRRAVLTKLKSEIQDKFISIYIKVGVHGKIFGHISTKLVCDEFEAQTGIHLDKKKVELPADINSVGIFTASVKLEKDIIATFEINVIEKKD
jgi:ribosomal protein L9